MAKVIKENNETTNLLDSYRHIVKEDGFTWKRGDTYSRLDYVFVSKALAPRVSKAEIDWAFETSDHALVKIIITAPEKIKKGPGIIKVNANILEDKNKLVQISSEISQMMSQAPKNWDPHTKLEFLKVTIRSVISSKVSENRNELKSEIEDLEFSLNESENIKLKITKNTQIDETERKERFDLTEQITIEIRKKLQSLRKKLSETTAFKSKAKWFEFGEKSNKFFLNLNKCRQSKKQIVEICNNGQTFRGQEQVTKCVKDFYSNLYDQKDVDTSNNDKDFYAKSPQLTVEQSKFMDTDLNLKDLYESLLSCKDSAPGPDGITYNTYKKLWTIAGPIILNAWHYSLQKDELPPSHKESIITLLPKEGKDPREIGNWRPITLSNCDAKIITKALTKKISMVLETIIDPSQTAYIPGRSVSDNLRTNFYYKNYCETKNIDAVLIWLDAKKAFDSVNHEYIRTTLKAYGFGTNFIKIFSLLYKDLSARVMVNGFMSEKIDIKQGVKQGDALSCALFIICIDLVLRNINANTKIEAVKIEGRKKNQQNYKGAAFADDISVICGANKTSVQQVFYEYDRLTEKSGLELNANKTEILKINQENTTITFNYQNQSFKVKTVNQIKICGLIYANNKEEEYKSNVNNKIKKMEIKLKQWTHRYLTMEGKSLIVKTFGLSQLIYNMQSYGFKKEDLIQIERMIFGFLWSSRDNFKGIDRIKRSIMKNDYKHGGMKITDIECLDRSLKLRQFIRSSFSNHEIAKIQEDMTPEKSSTILNEYWKVTDKEAICKTAQETINIITDYSRRQFGLEDVNKTTDKSTIEEVASINLKSYLKRKNRLFTCVLLDHCSI